MTTPDRKTVDDWFRSHGFNIPESTQETTNQRFTTYVDRPIMHTETDMGVSFTLLGLSVLGLTILIGGTLIGHQLASWLYTIF